jgi:hypothetical protein
LFNALREERTTLAEGVVYDRYDNPEGVKGRIQALDRILEVTFEDIYHE